MHTTLSFAMLMSRNRNHIINLEWLTFPALKRADANINVVAQQAQFFDMLQHLPPDRLLICLRQLLESLYRCFQYIRHTPEYTILHPTTDTNPRAIHPATARSARPCSHVCPVLR